MDFSYVAVDSDLLFVDVISASEQSVINKSFIQLGTEDIDSTIYSKKKFNSNCINTI